LYRADAVNEEIVPEEAGDVETIGGTSATPQPSSESSGFDSDNSSTDSPAEGAAANDSDGETSSTGETASDSVPKTDDEPVSGASDEQEAAVRKNLEKLNKLDEYDGYIFGERNRNYYGGKHDKLGLRE
jgi:hypothetical protein